MRPALAVDTSVAVPLLVETHPLNDAVLAWATGRSLALAGHAAAETYAVLTRLPGDARLAPQDAVLLIEDRLASTWELSASREEGLPRRLARLGVVGGATYDAMVAMAALEHDVLLATRDARARDTYERVGARVLLVG